MNQLIDIKTAEYLLLYPIEIAKNGQSIEAKQIILREPASKYKDDLFKLHNLCYGGFMKVAFMQQGESKKNTSDKKEEGAVVDEEGALQMYETSLRLVDSDKLISLMKKIFIQDGACLVEDMPMTLVMWEKLHLQDMVSMMKFFLLKCTPSLFLI